MAKNPRAATTKLIDLANQGVIEWEDIARAAMAYMSEKQVADMARVNEFFVDDQHHDFDDDVYDDYREVETLMQDYR